MQLRRVSRQLRRRLHRSQRQVEDLSQHAERDMDRYFFRRFNRLFRVRRFVISWVVLLVLLIGGVIGQNFLLNGYYQTLRPVPGGMYNEGVLGTFTNANPIYATSDADTTVSHLLFAGLFTYNAQNQLVGDLASGYTIDSVGTTYTVTLKPGLTWQDGQPLTAQDVAFTYHLIQNPDAESPLESSWQGVNVSAPNARTVVFKLQNVLASFPYSLTNGIVPEHLLKNIPTNELRSANFNTIDPIGAGPFAWQAIQVSGESPEDAQVQIALKPFAHYQGGEPKLQEFVVHTYADQNQLISAFQSGQLNGLEGLTEVPKSLKSNSANQVHSIMLSAGTYVFFKTTSGVLADQSVRTALVEGANVPSIISGLGYLTRPVQEPLLEGQLGYNPAYVQSGYNLSGAEALLTQDGWVLGKNGIRTKSGQQLSFTLTATNNPEYDSVSQQLINQWKKIGVSVQLESQSTESFTTTLSSHNYEAVLYGISIGVDPDVFVYWDSSQSDPRSAGLNFSEFNNPVADEALESGRTRLDPALRVIKYQPLLQVWQQEAPALGLYQPRLLYITNGLVSGLSEQTVNTTADRLNNVQNWEVRIARVTN
jgi:peptide/nickel transport system substrate-binding protein